MPMKNTKATPSEIPPMRTFPKASPNEQISDSTTTVCKADGVVKSPLIHSILYNCTHYHAKLV